MGEWYHIYYYQTKTYNSKFYSSSIKGVGYNSGLTVLVMRHNLSLHGQQRDVNRMLKWKEFILIKHNEKWKYSIKYESLARLK